MQYIVLLKYHVVYMVEDTMDTLGPSTNIWEALAPTFNSTTHE